MPGRTQPRAVAALAIAMLAAAWSAGAAAQPAGGTARFGGAQVQPSGNSMVVTTTNGAGAMHSVIDWRSFSVPAGSTTRFVQPSADSTSINRVTGGRPSDIFGTLASNGRLVLVNPSGIAVGKGAVVDTASFTASSLALDDADAIAGRLRFAAGQGKGDVDVRGHILARAGDVVLLGTDVRMQKEALVQASNGSVVVAAGQSVALTGRGLEGIVLELRAPSDRVVNLGRLEGDAVGLFASQLRHTGVIQAARVVLAGERVHLEPEGKDKQGRDARGESFGGIGTPGAGLDTNVPPGAANGAAVAATLEPPLSSDPVDGFLRRRSQADPALQCVR